MTGTEFKFWFNGFVDGLGSRIPTPAEWEIVIAKVKSIEDRKEMWTMPYCPPVVVPLGERKPFPAWTGTTCGPTS